MGGKEACDMTAKPKITFILPIYKVEAYLPRAFDSLLRQTSPDWEAILVDDGSPDNCGRLCDEIAAKDSRFKVVHQKNGGIGLARNAGLDAATGDYVHFYDPDDEITPEFVETVTAAAQPCGADVVYFAYTERYVDGAGNETGTRLITPPLTGVYTGEPFKEHFDVLTTLYYAWSKVVRRSLIEEHHVRFNQKKLVEDGIFYARFFRCSPRVICLIDTPLYRYTMGRGGSAIGSFHPERMGDDFTLSQTIESVLREWGLLESPMHFETLCYCYVRDLQLSIKNISLSPMSMSERTGWLKNIMRGEKLRKAVRTVPLSRILSRNDKIKLLLLKLKLCRAVMVLSGMNNRKRA